MAATPTPHSAPTARGDELELATALYAALTSGHDRLGYNVSGTYALWVRGPGGRGWLPAPGTPTVPRDEWRPCVEVLPSGLLRPRRFNPWVLREHVRGRYSVAPQAPSWTQWIAFDLDAHVAAEMLADGSDEVIPLSAVRRALAKRDGALAEVWRAFELGPDREPVIFETPGQGFHVYLPITRGELSPIEHTRPAGWLVEWVADRLHRCGVQLMPGRIELFPSGRPLRAPCGVRMTLLRATRPDQPDDLGLEPVPGTTAQRRVSSGSFGRFGDGGGDVVERVRRPWPMLAATLAQWEATRRPLEAWLGDTRAAWSPRKGPFVRPERAERGDDIEKNGCEVKGVDHKSQDKDEVEGRFGGRSLSGRSDRSDRSDRPLSKSQPSPPFVGSPSSQRLPSGVPRRGKEFRAYLVHLIRNGVVTPGTRHDAVLSLVFGWHVQGKREDEVRAELNAWARGHAHVSRLKGERFVKQCLREGMHYYHRIKKLPQRARSLAATVGRMRALGPADVLVVTQVAAEVREEAWAILEYLHGHAAPSGDVLDPVLLGRAQLNALTVADRRIRIDGRRHRAEVMAVRELERLGVLAIYVDYSRGRHGRVFSCWYRFGSGTRAPSRPPSAAGARAAPNAPKPCDGDGEALVLGKRGVREGIVRVLSDGSRRAPWVELEPHPGVVAEESGGGAWWRNMYERRRFTVRDLRAADESRVLAGPWQPTPRTIAARPPQLEPGAAQPSAVPAATSAAVEPTPAIAAVELMPAAPAAAADPCAALALELGASADALSLSLSDVDPELAALAVAALRAIDRRSAG